MRYIAYCIDLHTSKARYELKLVLLHLWRVNVKTILGFTHIKSVDYSLVNLRHNNITSATKIVDRTRQHTRFTEVETEKI